MGSNVNAEISVSLIKQPRGIIGGKVDMNLILKDLSEIVEDETFYIRNANIIPQQECRWHNISGDMKRLSQMYPGVLFSVKWNIPDYSDDSELDYFYEGKTHKAILSFSPFDEKLLK